MPPPPEGMPVFWSILSLMTMREISTWTAQDIPEWLRLSSCLVMPAARKSLLFAILPQHPRQKRNRILPSFWDVKSNPAKIRIGLLYPSYFNSG